MFFIAGRQYILSSLHLHWKRENQGKIFNCLNMRDDYRKQNQFQSSFGYVTFASWQTWQIVNLSFKLGDACRHMYPGTVHFYHINTFIKSGWKLKSNQSIYLLCVRNITLTEEKEISLTIRRNQTLRWLSLIKLCPLDKTYDSKTCSTIQPTLIHTPYLAPPCGVSG